MLPGKILKGFFLIVVIAGLSTTITEMGHAVGFGMKGGVGLLQKEDLTYGGTTAGQTLWMAGIYLDVGSGLSSRVRVAPVFEYSSRSNIRVVSLSLEGRYHFYQGPKAGVYAGMGPGINVKRITGTLKSERTVKGSLNVPIGVEWRLGKGGVRWTLEMKLAIADDQRDSAYRFGTGLAFSVK